MQSILRSDFIRKVFILFSGTSIAQLIPILISPILTRIYTAQEFGTFGLYVAIVALFSVISTGRFEIAILLPKKNIDAVQLTNLSLLLAVLFSVFISFPLLIWGDHLSFWFNNSNFKNVVYLIPIAIALNGFVQSLNYWTNRMNNFKLIALGKVGRSTGSSIAQIMTGLAQIGTIGLVFGQMFGVVIEVFILVKNYKLIKNFKIFSKKKLFNLLQSIKIFQNMMY